MDTTKIYSPNQIFGGSLWGGPIAAVYFIRQNYIALDNEEYAKKTQIFGSLFVIALFGILPFLPEGFPSMIIPLAYCLSAKQIAALTQLDKKKIVESEKYMFESNWKLFGIGFLSLLLFSIIAIGVMFTMEAMGLVSLP